MGCAAAILCADGFSLHRLLFHGPVKPAAILCARILPASMVCSRYPRCWCVAVDEGAVATFVQMVPPCIEVLQPPSSVQMVSPLIDCYSIVRGSQPPSSVLVCCSYRGVQLPSFVQMVSPCINGVAAAILGVIH